jgi:hypothetical protein
MRAQANHICAYRTVSSDPKQKEATSCSPLWPDLDTVAYIDSFPVIFSVHSPAHLGSLSSDLLRRVIKEVGACKFACSNYLNTWSLSHPLQFCAIPVSGTSDVRWARIDWPMSSSSVISFIRPSLLDHHHSRHIRFVRTRFEHCLVCPLSLSRHLFRQIESFFSGATKTTKQRSVNRILGDTFNKLARPFTSGCRHLVRRPISLCDSFVCSFLLPNLLAKCLCNFSLYLSRRIFFAVRPSSSLSSLGSFSTFYLRSSTSGRSSLSLFLPPSLTISLSLSLSLLFVHSCYRPFMVHFLRLVPTTSSCRLLMRLLPFSLPLFVVATWTRSKQQSASAHNQLYAPPLSWPFHALFTDTAGHVNSLFVLQTTFNSKLLLRICSLNTCSFLFFPLQNLT